MAFTYTDTLAANRDKVRFYLQDVVESSGPRPIGGNFSDAELDGLIALEGDWQRAVAAGLETLANAWAIYAALQEGPHQESFSQIASAYRQQAAIWRARAGAATPTHVAGIVKVDGYSDDIASDEVDTSSEYGLVWEYVRVKE